MWIRNFLLFSILLLASFFHTHGQERDLIQVSGVVISTDSLQPVPFTTIIIGGQNRGTIASFEGFFSLPVYAGDSIAFSSVGFRREWFKVPENYDDEKLNLIMTLDFDTVTTQETVIYPLPSPSEFKEAFVSLDLRKDPVTRAKEHLQRGNLLALGNRMTMDGPENQQYQLMRYAQQLYYAGGQTPYFYTGGGATLIPASLLDPFAWTQFVRSLQNGDFKRKDYEYVSPDQKD